jgi:hypothetical protein
MAEKVSAVIITICTQFGCKIFYRRFTGYGEQKSFAINQAANNWVLCIDADEYLTPELVDELQRGLNDMNDYNGYLIPMNLVFREQEFKYGKESHNYFMRLFNKNYCIVSDKMVHENFNVSGPVKKLKNIILHYSYRDINQVISKIDRYSSLGATDNRGRGKKRSQIMIYLCLPYYFIRYYLLDRNFLNGKNGFYWSVFSSVYHFTKYVKMQDVEQKEQMEKTKIVSLEHPTIIKFMPPYANKN